MKPPAQSEAALQTQVANYFIVALGPDVYWFHAPNEGKRGGRAQRDFKAFGAKSGVPDFAIIHNGRALFIELKSVKGRTSATQIDAHYAIKMAGGLVETCRTLDGVIGTLRGWGIPMRVTTGLVELPDPKTFKRT